MVNTITRILSLLSGILMVFISLTVIIFSTPEVSAEGGGPEIHLNELGFSMEFVDTLSTTLYCPRFEQNSDWETQIIISNPSENDANVVITYYTSTGQLIDDIQEQIEAKNTMDFISTDHNIEEESGSIVITSDVPIFGNIVYYSSYCAAAEPLQVIPYSILYCPGFYQTGTWETYICINNVETETTDVTLTYYNDQGTVIDSIADSLTSNELRYFRPVDDGIEAELGSIVIESEDDQLIGYVLKINSDDTIAYSYSLTGELDNVQGTTFITGEDNNDDLIFFNPESVTKNLDLTFYNEMGNSINSLTDQEILPFETFIIIINDYDEGNSLGTVKIECDNNGIIGIFEHISSNYGLANSIKTTTTDTFYSSLISYKEVQYPSISMTNPLNEQIEVEFMMYDIDEEGNSQNTYFGTPPFFQGQTILGSNSIYGEDFPITFWPKWGSAMVFGSGENPYFDNPNFWSSPDSDGDGLDDHIEDSLFPTYISPQPDTDGDGVFDGKHDPDTDGDTLPDGWEYYKLGGRTPIIDATSPNGRTSDADNDALLNYEEYYYGTHPLLGDTDGDELGDHGEINDFDTDPLDSDPDNDRLTDKEEVQTYNTDPWKWDTDDDGMEDGWEVFNGVGLGYGSPNPLVSDANSDPDDDWLNNIGEFDNNLNPHDPDCDNDGRYDGIEYWYGLDPKCGGIKWTIMSYVAADCGIEDDLCNDVFNEMEAVGCTDDITIISQVDRKSIGQGVVAFKNPRRFVIVNNNEYIIENLWESSTGDPDTLFDFIDWGLDNFPADKYALIIHGHGWGCRGCCPDTKDGLYGGETPDDYDDYLTLDEFDDCHFGNFDLLGFDCCKMGSIEVLSELYYENADIVVASEWDEQVAGWPYDDILEWLEVNPSCTAKQFGTQIVEEYHNEWSNDILCAIDLNKYENLEENCKYLAKELKEAMEENDLELKDHYKNTTFPSAIENADITGDNLGDLYYFADWLSKPSNVYKFNLNDTYYSNIRDYASEVKKYLYDGTSSEKCVFELEKGAQYSKSMGINVYLPYNADDIGDWLNTKNYYINLTFSKKTNWDDMLEIKVEYV